MRSQERIAPASHPSRAGITPIVPGGEATRNRVRPAAIERPCRSRGSLLTHGHDAPPSCRARAVLEPVRWLRGRGALLPLRRSGSYRLLLIAMLGRMVFCRFLCVVDSVEMVSLSNVSVMSCLFVRARLMMLGRFKMMACGMLMVLSCLLVVLCTLVSSHLLWSPFANALLPALSQISSIIFV